MKKILKYCFNTSLWTPTRQEWLQILSAITKEERERIDKYMFKRDAKQTLIGHLLIRYALKNLLSVDWNHIVLARTSNGRPYLKIKETLQNFKSSSSQPSPSSPPSTASAAAAAAATQLTGFSSDLIVDFNVSHAGDYAIVAAGIASSTASKQNENQEVFRIGVDIMKVDADRGRQQQQQQSSSEQQDEALYRKQLLSHERVLNTKFSDIEKNYIRNRYNDVERLTAFYRLWCLKESYVKAIGEGMGFDLKRLEFMVTSDLYLDLNGKKHLVVNDSQLYIDAKHARQAQFYVQYYTDINRSAEQASKPANLHIMTMCIIEKEATNATTTTTSSASASASASARNTSDNNEFIEIGMKELKDAFVVIEKIDNSNMEDFEDFWLSFKNKAEAP